MHIYQLHYVHAFLFHISLYSIAVYNQLMMSLKLNVHLMYLILLIINRSQLNYHFQQYIQYIHFRSFIQTSKILKCIYVSLNHACSQKTETQTQNGSTVDLWVGFESSYIMIPMNGTCLYNIVGDSTKSRALVGNY